MASLFAVSGIMKWCDCRGFHIERPKERTLRLVLPIPMNRQADDMLYQHVSLHGRFESHELFAVHSLASAEG